MIVISERLKQIAIHIPNGSNFADIGSDHAFLSAYLCLKDSEMNAIAGEVRQGPFEAAVNTVQKFQLTNQIDVRLGDGLEVINQTDVIDTVVIAGMGGKLIIKILMEEPDIRKRINRFILQPNTFPEEVRAQCEKWGIPLSYESIVEDQGHLYEILIFDRSEVSAYNPHINLNKQFLFGPYLMKEKPALFIKKWQYKYKQTKQIVERMKQGKHIDQAAQNELQMRLKWMEELLYE